MPCRVNPTAGALEDPGRTHILHRNELLSQIKGF